MKKANQIILGLISIAGIISCTKKPVACFHTDKTEYIAGETVKLTDCSVNANDIEWTLPDGASSGSRGATFVIPISQGNGTLLFTQTVISKKEKKADQRTHEVNVSSIRPKFLGYYNTSYDCYAFPAYSVEIAESPAGNDKLLLKNLLLTPACYATVKATITSSKDFVIESQTSCMGEVTVSGNGTYNDADHSFIISYSGIKSPSFGGGTYSCKVALTY